MFQAYQSMWRHALDFHGKTNRYDYWTALLATFYLILIELQIVLFSQFLFQLSGEATLTLHAGLGLPILMLHSLPLISLTLRRLNDAGQPIRLALLLAIPGIGWMILAFFLAKPSLFDREARSSGKETFWQAYPKFSGCIARAPFWKKISMQLIFPTLAFVYIGSVFQPEDGPRQVNLLAFLLLASYFNYWAVMIPHWLGMISQRLRDAGKSTKYSFLFLIPLLGTIPLAHLLSKPSKWWE